MYLLYDALLVLYFMAVLPSLLYRRLRHGIPLGPLGDRLGWLGQLRNAGDRPAIWVHAVSVGEVKAARPLLDDLRDAYPAHRLYLSTTTATGQAVARELGRIVDGVFYAPLDFPLFVTGILNRLCPQLMVVVDTELWPNWLRVCRRRGVRTAIVNGRISDRSYRRYRMVRWFTRQMLRDVDLVCSQTEGWGRRFVELGLPEDRLIVSGSLKFDAPDPSDANARVVRDLAFVAPQPVWIAASTLPGEDEIVLQAFAGLRRGHRTALLIVAPRHPERAPAICDLACQHGFRTVLRTSLPRESAAPVDVIVLDTIGELASVFPLATVVFVGGSLVAAGGHNVLEPAVCGRAIVFGPHMQNFGEIADLFLRRSAAIQVRSGDELERAVVRLFQDPRERSKLGQAAQVLIEENRGARVKTLEALRDLLPLSPRTESGHEVSCPTSLGR